jgi:hypothetical protein
LSDNLPENLTIEDLMTRWGVSLHTLAKWRMEGKGPKYFKIGRKVFYPTLEVLAFEAKRPRFAGSEV